MQRRRARMKRSALTPPSCELPASSRGRPKARKGRFAPIELPPTPAAPARLRQRRPASAKDALAACLSHARQVAGGACGGARHCVDSASTVCEQRTCPTCRPKAKSESRWNSLCYSPASSAPEFSRVSCCSFLGEFLGASTRCNSHLHVRHKSQVQLNKDDAESKLHEFTPKT